ncbi:MAG: hypothetical protein ACYCOU_26500, partial [Sulfobacillus sp.]
SALADLRSASDLSGISKTMLSATSDPVLRLSDVRPLQAWPLCLIPRVPRGCVGRVNPGRPRRIQEFSLEALCHTLPIPILLDP